MFWQGRDAPGSPPRDRGLWVGASLGVAAAGGCVLIVAHGGGSAEVAPRLQVAALVGLVGLVTALAVRDRVRGPRRVILWIAALVLGGACLNLMPLLVGTGPSGLARLVSVMPPSGGDFRGGLYEPALAFSNAGSIWPPLTLIVGRAYTLMSWSDAYVVHVVVLIASAAASAFLASALAVRVSSTEGASGVAREVGPRQLSIVAGCWLLTSYGFLFEIERGNANLVALLLMLLAVWLLVSRPRHLWLCAFCLALAVSFKVYPATLLVLVFWRWGLRALLPVTVTNVALLLVAGPANAARFLVNLTSAQTSEGYVWLGNHSAVSFAQTVATATGGPANAIVACVVVLSLGLWTATIAVLVRRGWSERGGVLAAASCVPVMCVLPTLSHDYKLVVLVFPLSVLFAVLATAEDLRPTVWSVAFAVVGLETVLLARSTLLMDTAHLVVGANVLANKLPAILLLKALLLAAAWLPAEPRRRPARAERLASGRTEEACLEGLKQ